MARSQSSGVVKVIGVGAAVIVGSVTIGYLFGGLRDAHPGVQPAQPPVSATLTPSPAAAPPAVHPRTTNGNYTAPGAPHIVIEEESQPVIRRVIPPAAAAADPEATQEAAPVTPKPAANEAKTTDTVHTPSSDTGAAAPGAPDNAASGTPSPAAPAPAAPPADPDFEHVNTPPSGASDPAGGQSGGKTPSDRSQDNHGQADATKVQFRVQTGAYTDESNARSVADTLRSQGFSASTRSERDGDRLIYKIQVGAYRSKNGADKAADDLQRKGYPAFISPVGP